MDEKQIKANEARSFLHSEVWKRAYEKTRASIHSQWEKEADKDKRDTLWHTLKGLDLVVSQLAMEASSAVIEEIQKAK